MAVQRYTGRQMFALANARTPPSSIIPSLYRMDTAREAKLQFVIRHDTNGKPIAFLTPEDKRGWFWLQSGACIEKRLFLFLTQVERTDTNSVFGFRQVGQWLGVVTNPLDPPIAWHVVQRRSAVCQILARSSGDIWCCHTGGWRLSLHLWN